MIDADFPMRSWCELKTILDEESLEKLGRSKEQQNEYAEFRRQLNIDWITVTDYVLVSKMNFRQIVRDDGKFAAERLQVMASRLVVVRNDFPYNFGSGVEHFVLWKTGSELVQSEIDAAAQRICMESGALDFVTFTNPPTLKSILDIEHAHIILKLPPHQTEMAITI